MPTDSPSTPRPADPRRTERITDAIRFARQRRDAGSGSVWSNLLAILGRKDAECAMTNLMWADKGFSGRRS